MPKFNSLVPFSNTGPPRVDLFCFGRFCAMQKNGFPIGLKSSKNLKKWSKGRQKDDGTARPIARGHGLGCLGPVSGHARDKAWRVRALWKEGKNARRPVGKWKEGKVGTASRQEGKFEGSNTPVGQRPGEFISCMFPYFYIHPHLFYIYIYIYIYICIYIYIYTPIFKNKILHYIFYIYIYIYICHAIDKKNKYTYIYIYIYCLYIYIYMIIYV